LLMLAAMVPKENKGLLQLSSAPSRAAAVSEPESEPAPVWPPAPPPVVVVVSPTGSMLFGPRPRSCTMDSTSSAAIFNRWEWRNSRSHHSFSPPSVWTH
jgi:hypothetical protein